MASFARSADNPRRRIEDVIIEGRERELAQAKRLGAWLSTFFLLLWIGTALAMKQYPAFFNIVAACN
ncbi:MAG: hypothetical protein JWL87_655 [Candidatus Adlerbacteria bacterium]|nr:hypothetical protein [Candidatus Adlerbacteria bacterium]